MSIPKSANETVSLSAKKDTSTIKSLEKPSETSQDYQKALITNLGTHMTDPAHQSTFLIQKDICDMVSSNIANNDTVEQNLNPSTDYMNSVRTTIVFQLSRKKMNVMVMMRLSWHYKK